MNWYFSQYCRTESRCILVRRMTLDSTNFPEHFRAQTEEILRRFRGRQISFPDCIAALDAALAELVPRLDGGQIEPLRAIVLTNNDTVMDEMARRGLHPVVAWPRSTRLQ